MKSNTFTDLVRRYEMFGVRVEPEIYEGKYFITSRQAEGTTKYTIRRMDDDGSVIIFGTLHGFTTRVGAEQWLIGQRR
jgi:hypothetical protein